MANLIDPNSDPRYALARQMAASRSSLGGQGFAGATPIPGPQSETAVKLGRTAASLAATNPALQARLQQIRAARPKEPTGIGGYALKALGTAGNILGLPGRAVVSTLREGVDILDSDPNTRASFGDLTKQIQDPTFGFGKAFKIDTGNKWLDRAIGFVGDVALDPLTYATLGAGKFAGASGRLALGKEVYKVTGDNLLTQAVIREGRVALKDVAPDVLERIGANRSGIYFFGKRLKVGKLEQGWRLPFSGFAGDALESGLGRLRLAASETKLGARLQKLTTPAAERDDILKLRRGLLKTEEVGPTTLKVLGRNTQRAAMGAARAEIEKSILDFVSDPDVIASKSTLYRIAENPALLDTATDVERRAYAKWKQLQEFSGNNVRLKAQELGADIPLVENYFPRQMTDEAKVYVGNENNPYAVSLYNNLSDNIEYIPGSFNERKLTSGSEFFGYRLTDEDIAGGVERLNQIARENGFKGDFFETDITKAIQKYAYNYEQEMGIWARHKYNLDNGLYKKVEDARFMENYVDATSVKEASQFVKDTSKRVDDSLVKLAKANENLMNVTARQADVTVASVGGVLDEYNNALTVLDGALAEFNSAKAALADLLDIEDLKAAEIASNGRVVGLGQDFIDQLDWVNANMQRYSDEIASLQTQLDDAIATGANTAELASTLRARQQQLGEELNNVINESIQSMQKGIEFSNIISARFDDIINGVNIRSTKAVPVPKEYEQILKRMNIVMGGKGSGRSSARVLGNMFGVEGSLKDFIVSALKTGDEGVAILRSAGIDVSGLNVKAISNMSEEQFDNIVTNVFNDASTIADVKNASLRSILQDIRFYGDNIPEALIPHRDRLLKAINDAIDAETLASLQRRTVEKQTVSNLEAFREKLTFAIEKAKDNLAESDELSGVATRLREYLDANPELRDQGVYIRVLENQFGDNHYVLNLLKDSSAYKSQFDETMILMNAAEESDQFADFMTMGELLDTVESRLNTVNFYLDNPVHDLGGAAGSVSELKLSGRQVLEEGSSRLRAVYQADTPKIQRMISAGVDSVADAKSKLGDALIAYQVVSEVHYRFDALAQLYMPFGQVPTQRAYAAITHAVGDRFGKIAETRLNNMYKSEIILKDLRNSFSEARRQIALEGIEESPSTTFRRLVNDVLDSPDGDYLRAAFGDVVNSMEDPEELLRIVKNATGTKQNSEIVKLANEKVKSWFVVNFPNEAYTPETAKKYLSALSPKSRAGQEIFEGLGQDAKDAVSRILRNKDELDAVESLRLEVQRAEGKAGVAARRKVFEERVRPWFESRFPGERFSQSEARRRIKMIVAEKRSAVGMARGPFAANASPWDIDNWFTDLLGGERLVRRAQGPTKTTYWNKARKSSEAESRTVEGLLNVRVRSARRTMNLMDNLRDPNVNISAFFDDPLQEQVTPSLYASLLRRQADELEEIISTKSVKDEAKKVADQNLKQASKELDSVQRELNRVEAGKPTSGRSKFAEEGDPTLESVRKLKQKYDSAIATPLYLKAQHDRTMVDAMIGLAGFKMENFKNGFVLKSTEVDEFGNPIVRYATLENGERIVFTEDEWNSLFVDVMRISPSNVGEMRSRQGRLVNEIGRNRKRVDELKNSIRTAKSRLTKFNNSRQRFSQELKAQRAKMVASIEKAEKELTSLNQIVSDSQRELVRLQKGLQVYNQGVQQSALEKMRVLVHGRAGQEPVFDEVGLSSFKQNISRTHADLAPGVSGTGRIPGKVELNVPRATDGTVDIKASAIQYTPASALSNTYLSTFYDILVPDDGTVARRVEELTKMWQASEEFKFLSEVDGLQKTSQYMMYERMLTRTDEATAVVEKMRAAANAAERAAARSKSDLDTAISQAVHYVTKGTEAAGVVKPGFAPTVEAGVENLSGLTSRLRQISGEVGAVRSPMRPTRTLSMAENVPLQRAQEEVFGLAGEQQGIASALGRVQGLVDETSQQIDELTGQLLPRQARLAKWQEQYDELAKIHDEQVKRVAVEKRSRAQKVVDAQSTVNEKAVLVGISYGSIDEALDLANDAQSISRLIRSQAEGLKESAPPLKKPTRPKGIVKPTKPKIRNAQTMAKYQSDLAEYESKIAAYNMEVRQWRESTVNYVEELQSFNDEVAELVDTAGIQDDVVLNARRSATVLEGEFLANVRANAAAFNWLESAKAGVMRERIIKPFEEGWAEAMKASGIDVDRLTSMADAGLPMYGVDKSLYELMTNVERIKLPGYVNDLSRFLGPYTRFFKTYATLSPGFHIRNAISNMFSLFSAGADVENMFAGLKLYNSQLRHLRGGGTIESWLQTLPEAERAFAKIASDSELVFSGGRIVEALSDAKNNAAVNLSRRFGRKVEGSAHFILAYDSAVKGMNFDTAFARSKRYLFDYGDPTELDLLVRNVFPFWTWTSRNLPLQLMNRVANPKAYNAYNNFVKNFSEEDGTPIPQYMRDSGMVNLGGGRIFNPELPLQAAEEQLRNLGSKKQLASLTPALRIPLELLEGRNYFSGAPIDNKLEYALKAAVPPLSTAGRLSGIAGSSAGTPNAWLSWTGVPVQQVSRRQQENELRRQLAEIIRIQQEQRGQQ